MRLDCPKCGAKGDSRAKKQPRWRCSPAAGNGGCGYEWDDPNYNDPDIEYKSTPQWMADAIRIFDNLEESREAAWTRLRREGFDPNLTEEQYRERDRQEELEREEWRRQRIEEEERQRRLVQQRVDRETALQARQKVSEESGERVFAVIGSVIIGVAVLQMFYLSTDSEYKFILGIVGIAVGGMFLLGPLIRILSRTDDPLAQELISPLLAFQKVVYPVATVVLIGGFIALMVVGSMNSSGGDDYWDSQGDCQRKIESC